MQQAMDGYAWDSHGQFEDLRSSEYAMAIRKTACIVMADQLWMWVLDKNTILTCFPQRYGMASGRADPSGVHQSIRNRMRDRRNISNEVTSAFDLAMIILDECSDAAFDGASTGDMRPRVLDIFGASIGDVVSHAWPSYM